MPRGSASEPDARSLDELGVAPGRTEAAGAARSLVQFVDLVPAGLYHRSEDELGDLARGQAAEVPQKDVERLRKALKTDKGA